MIEYFTLTNLFYMIIFIICIKVVHLYITPKTKNMNIIPSAFSNTKRVEIPAFNKDNYIKQLFSNTFYSITNDIGWTSRYWSNSVTFTKHEDRKKRNSYDDIPLITLDIKFEFKNNEMCLREAKLKSGYDSYDFDGLFTTELLDFVYIEYKKYREKGNQEELDKIEDSVKSINTILGKSVERGSKLNDLL